VSLLVATGIFGLARLVLPLVYAVFTGVPFLGIAAYVAWKQLKAPSEAQVAKKLELIRAMASEEFTRALEEGFRREGWAIERLKGAAADLEMTRGRTALVACRRYKAANTGVDPLRELEELRRARKADECVYVTAGALSEQARGYARERNVRIVEGAALAALVQDRPG
jgi:restriction system protein